MNHRPDPAHKETERIIRQMEMRLTAEYQQAAREVQEKLDDYLRRFAAKDSKWRQWVKQGEKTEKEYQQWRQGQIAVGERWESLKDQLSADLYKTDQIARGIIEGYKPNIYAINHNYGTYEIESGLGIDTSFTLYNREAVERLIRENPDMLPPPGKRVSAEIAKGKAIRWNKQHLQSAMIQGILQGESIPALATRIVQAVGDSNRKAAIRNARTMATAAQNAGRVDAYQRAKDKGINLKQTWVATLDMRTRHEHRQLDGQTVEVGQPFEIDGYKLRFPCDPKGPPYLVYNCRCTVIGQVKGVEVDVTKTDVRSKAALKGMTYDEWKAEKQSESNPIDLPEKKAKSIKGMYISQYRR